MITTIQHVNLPLSTHHWHTKKCWYLTLRKNETCWSSTSTTSVAVAASPSVASCPGLPKYKMHRDAQERFNRAWLKVWFEIDAAVLHLECQCCSSLVLASLLVLRVREIMMVFLYWTWRGYEALLDPRGNRCVAERLGQHLAPQLVLIPTYTLRKSYPFSIVSNAHTNFLFIQHCFMN